MADERKTRGDSVLDGELSPAEQESFFAFAETHTLAEAKRWLHDHRLITLSTEAISKWLAKRRKEAGEVKFREYLATMRDDNERAIELGTEIGSAAHLNDANVLMLSQALFEARRSNDPRQVREAAKLFAMVLEANAKAKAAEAAVITAGTSRDKFQFDAARAIDARLDELTALKREVTDDAERRQRIIETVFGRRPGHLTSNSAGGIGVGAGSAADQEDVNFTNIGQNADGRNEVAS